MVQFLKFCSKSLHGKLATPIDCRNVVKSVRSCVIYRTTSKFRLLLKLSLMNESRPKSARANPQHMAHHVPSFIQIGSLSAEL